MAVKMAHKELIRAMELRFDFQSARNVLAEVLKTSGVGEKPDYEKADLAKVAGAIKADLPMCDRVIEEILSFGDESPKEEEKAVALEQEDEAAPAQEQQKKAPDKEQKKAPDKEQKKESKKDKKKQPR